MIAPAVDNFNKRFYFPVLCGDFFPFSKCWNFLSWRLILISWRFKSLWKTCVLTEGLVNITSSTNMETLVARNSSEEICLSDWTDIAQPLRTFCHQPLQLRLKITRLHWEQASAHDYVLVITLWVCPEVQVVYSFYLSPDRSPYDSRVAKMEQHRRYEEQHVRATCLIHKHAFPGQFRWSSLFIPDEDQSYSITVNNAFFIDWILHFVFLLLFCFSLTCLLALLIVRYI